VKPALDTSPAEEFGPYVVYERLGMGGMAVVHRAKKQGIAGFERKLALKRLLPHLAEDAEFIASFVREAKVASLLVHPNICQIYDFGRIEGVYYIAMEHVDGFDVRQLLRFANKSGEHIPLGVVLSILIELCEALEYAHHFVDENGTPHGIVHRDVSPSNLLVAHTGHLKVIDFGIAKAESRQLHTESGRVKGKLGYMSPEAAMGTVFGPVSDVFSTGVVAHELLTASPLFSAKTDFETMLRIREAEIEPPSTKNPAVPEELDQVVLAALSRNPETRTQTAGELRAQLEAIAALHGIRVQPREVAEWMTRFAQPEDNWARSSNRSPQYPPPETTKTSNLRPPMPMPMPGPTTGSIPSIASASKPSLRAVRVSQLPGGPPPAEQTFDGVWGPQPSPSPRPPGDFSISSPAAMPTPSHQGMLPPPPAASTSRAPVIILMTLLLVAAGLGGFLLYQRSTRSAAVPATTSAATVRFEIQPASSIIEIGGKEISRTSPYDHTLEPGMYSVTVRQPGFKPWSGSITLRDGDRQTINVALERGSAKVALDSQPRGLIVTLDGEATSHRTPATIEVPTGEHTVTVTNAAGEVWTQDFVAELDGSYTFTAPLTGDTDRPDKPDKPDKQDKKPRTKVSQNDKPTGKDPEVIPDAGVEIKEPEVLPPPPPPVKPPPPPPVKPDKPARTPLVAASSVTKLSGEIPTIKGNSEGSQKLTVKVCIDEQGKVTSAKVTKASDIAIPLQNAILSWRYKPYRNKDNQVSAVCFPLQVGVVVRRSN
jgi:serine/threonine-protein kinase